MENLYIQTADSNPHNIIEFESGELLSDVNQIKVHSSTDVEGKYLYILPRAL